MKSKLQFALVLFLCLSVIGCSSAAKLDKPSLSNADLQSKAEELMKAIEAFYAGTTRQGTVTALEYDGSTVTVKTAIYPDTEGIESIKQMRVGLYTFLSSYNEDINVTKVCVIDAGGNAWVYP